MGQQQSTEQKTSDDIAFLEQSRFRPFMADIHNTCPPETEIAAAEAIVASAGVNRYNIVEHAHLRNQNDTTESKLTGDLNYDTAYHFLFWTMHYHQSSMIENDVLKAEVLLGSTGIDRYNALKHEVILSQPHENPEINWANQILLRANRAIQHARQKILHTPNFTEDVPLQVYGSACCFNGGFNNERVGRQLSFDDAKDLGIEYCAICGLKMFETYEAVFGIGCNLSDTRNSINTVDPRILQAVLPKYVEDVEEVNHTVEKYEKMNSRLPHKPVTGKEQDAYYERLRILEGMKSPNPDKAASAQKEYDAIIRLKEEKERLDAIEWEKNRKRDHEEEARKINEYVTRGNVIRKEFPNGFALEFAQVPDGAICVKTPLGSSIPHILEDMASEASRTKMVHVTYANGLEIVIPPPYAEHSNMSPIELSDLYEFKYSNELYGMHDTWWLESYGHEISPIKMGIHLVYRDTTDCKSVD